MVREYSRSLVPVFVGAGAVTFALVSGPASADLYRWVDAKGVVNYSNIPPQGVAAKRIAETEPTVSVIPPREKPPEVIQAEREAAMVRRIERLEDELAELRRASAPTVVYTYPVPASVPDVIYSTPVVYPFPVYPWPVHRLGQGYHRHKPGYPGVGSGSRPGGKASVVSPRGGQSGLSVRARF